MKLKVNSLKNKIINNLVLKGKKELGEILILNTFKKLQKNSFKQAKHLVNLSVLSSMHAFKTSKTVKKGKKKKIKETLMIIRKMKIRFSLSIKLILNSLINKNSKNFYLKLCEEIITNAKKEGFAVQMKNRVQKETLLKKHFFYYYRWVCLF